MLMGLIAFWTLQTRGIQAIYDFVSELYKTKRVSERTYRRVHAFLGDGFSK